MQHLGIFVLFWAFMIKDIRMRGGSLFLKCPSVPTTYWLFCAVS